jgi:glutamate-1-semialdehyde 2,1-aminomutase
VAGVQPHLSIFGKAVANGYPMGVIGGRKDIMNLFDAEDVSKKVLIAGTYNAHPVNTAAAIATLEMLQNKEVYGHIEKMSSFLYNGLQQIFSEKSMAIILNSNASAFCVYFCDKQPQDAHDILQYHDAAFDLRYRKALIEKGIYHIPIAAKQGSVSYTHTEEDIYKTLDCTREVLRDI